MKFKIQILEPCHEDWNLMTPSGKGRHCEACDKVVVDFTRSTKREIAKYIANNENICGRISEEFLGVTLEDEKEKKSFGLNGLVATVVNLLAITTAMNAQTMSPENQSIKAIERIQVRQDNSSLLCGDKKQTMLVHGVVVSALDGFGMPGTSVTIKDTEIGVTANFEGEFEIPINVQNNEVVLLFSFMGYVSKEVSISEDTPLPLKIFLEEESGEVGEIIINTGYQKLSRRKITGIVARIEATELKVVSEKE